MSMDFVYLTVLPCSWEAIIVTGAERLHAHLGKRTQLEGSIPCGSCHEGTGDDLVVCAECAAPFHARCWEMAGGCAVQDCSAGRGPSASPYRPRPDSRRFRWQPRTKHFIGALLCMGFGAWVGGMVAVLAIQPQLRAFTPDFAGPNCDVTRLLVARPALAPDPLDEITALLDADLDTPPPVLTFSGRVLLVNDEPPRKGPRPALPPDSDRGVTALLDALEKAGEAETISRPSIRVQSGTSAAFSVTGNTSHLAVNMTPQVDAEGIVDVALDVDIQQQFAGTAGKPCTGTLSKQLAMRLADGQEGVLFLGPLLAPKSGSKPATPVEAERKQVVLVLTAQIENEADPTLARGIPSAP
jgi:hypothetical protein